MADPFPIHERTQLVLDVEDPNNGRPSSPTVRLEELTVRPLGLPPIVFAAKLDLGMFRPMQGWTWTKKSVRYPKQRILFGVVISCDS